MNDPTIAVLEPRSDGDDDHWIAVARQAGAAAMRDRIPSHYRDAVATDPDVQAYARKLIEGATRAGDVAPAVRSGPSLLLLGGTGSGKTYEAYGVVRAVCVSGAACRWEFTSAADLYARLRPRPGVDSEQEFERYSRASLLVLDDLGAAKTTEWTEEINYRLVNYRYERDLPTLITSNVPPKQLGAAMGERVASRLIEMTSRVILAEADRRLG